MGVTWRAAPTLSGDDVSSVLATVERRLLRLLARRGLTSTDEGSAAADVWGEEAPVLAGMAAASVQGVAALGRRAGARVRRCGAELDTVAAPALGRCHARWDGFDLHAGLVVPAGDRERLERVCRYALRPPVPQDRLCLTSDGEVQLTLRRRWSDGTTHVVFDPVEFLARLAALTPRPRINRGSSVNWTGLQIHYPPNPLQDVNTLKHVAFVMKNGKVVKRPS